MYCTLQEAYQIPSFDPSSKKQKKGTCAGARNVTPDTYEPRAEQAAYLPAPPAPRVSSRSGAGTCREGFVGNQLPAISDLAEPTYNNMRMDRQYYCDNFNVCDEGVKPNPKVREDYYRKDRQYYCDKYNICEGDIKPTVTKPAGTVPAAGPEGFENPPPKTMDARQCGRLQPPMYELPLADDSRRAYDSAFKVAIEEGEQNVATPPQKMRVVDMNEVDGYYDEDLENYLQTKEMKASVMAEPPRAPKPLKPSSGMLIGGHDEEREDEVVEKKSETKKMQMKVIDDHWGRWLDLVLFFFAGILLIILCDQLIKLGMMMGMRKSFDIMIPLLREIESKLKK